MPLPNRQELENRYGKMAVERQAQKEAAARQIAQDVSGAVSGVASGLMDQVRDFQRIAESPVAQSYLRNFLTMSPRRTGYTELADLGRAAIDPQTYKNIVTNAYDQITGGPESFGRFVGQNINPFGRFGGVAKRDIFIGEKARTWDAAAANRAVEMEKAGHTPEAIWQATGTYRSPDGELRQEISDLEAKAAFTHLPPSTERITATALSHPELQKAYPELANIDQFGLREKKERGSLEHTVMPDDSVKYGMMIGYAPNEERLKSVLLHEYQHAVQAQENFARGGTAKEFAPGPMFSQKAKDLNFDLSKTLSGTGSLSPSEVVDSLKYGDERQMLNIVKRYGFNSVDDAIDYLKKQDIKRTPHGQYERLAGEAEARAVQARMNMTPFERRAKFPLQSYDITPLSDLIMRRY